VLRGGEYGISVHSHDRKKRAVDNAQRERQRGKIMTWQESASGFEKWTKNAGEMVLLRRSNGFGRLEEF
jgi:hypothetical protein